LQEEALLLSGEINEDLFTYKGYLKILPSIEMLPVLIRLIIKKHNVSRQT